MKVFASIYIQVSPEEIFDYTQDYSNRLVWDTFLKEACMVGDAIPKIGEKAWCVSKHGIGMETEYINFKRPNVVAIKMTKGPWYLHEFSGSWRFQQEGNAGTKVTFTYSIKFRGILENLLRPFSNLVKKNIEQRLKDLKFSLAG